MFKLLNCVFLCGCSALVNFLESPSEESLSSKSSNAGKSGKGGKTGKSGKSMKNSETSFGNTSASTLTSAKATAAHQLTIDARDKAYEVYLPTVSNHYKLK